MEKNVIILGLTLGFHKCSQSGEKVIRDQAASLVVDGAVVSAIDNRKFLKMNPNPTSIPLMATVQFVLQDYGIQLAGVDKIALVGAEDDWNREDSFDIRRHTLRLFRQTFDLDISSKEISFVHHHAAYGMNIFPISGFKRCLFLILHYPKEEGGTLGIFKGEENQLEQLDSFSFPQPLSRDALEKDIIPALVNYQKQTGYTALCITGNGTFPGILQEKISSVGIFEDLFVQPAEHAVGWAMGAGMYVHHQETPGETPAEKTFVTYRNNTERILVQTWKKLLLKENISINDDFFHLGGNSLKAIELENEIHNAFRVRLSLAEIFKNSTIKELSLCIGALKADEEGNDYPAIYPAEKREFYELSSAQKRLYSLQQIDEQGMGYNLPTLLLLEGHIETGKLEQGIKDLINRHESLRTSFEIIGGEPVQRIHDHVEFGLAYFEGHRLDRFPDREKQLPRGLLLDLDDIAFGFSRPFDLSMAPLLRAGVGLANENHYFLVVDMHHIIADGFSSLLMLNEFIGIYNGHSLPRLHLQYRDFSQWQNNWLRGKKITPQEEFWLKQFEGDVPVLELHTDYPRPERVSFEGDSVHFVVNRQLNVKLRELMKETGTSLYMLLLAVFVALLFKHTGQEDVVVGSPVTGRPHPDLQNIIGMFANMLSMRNFPQKNKTFENFLVEVKENAINAYQNQDFQFDELVRKLGLQGSHGRNPLFDVVFHLNNIELKATESTDLNIHRSGLKMHKVPFDLVLEAEEVGDEIRMNLAFAAVLFKQETADRLTKRYLEIMEQVVKDKTIPLGNIKISHDRWAVKTDISPDDGSDFCF
jgi:acyl carrier protein